MNRWRERIFGTDTSIGWWVFPVFLAVGIAGAVLAGALTVVYYSQQVSGLRADIRDTAARLDSAVEEVENARADAIDEITEQLEAVREALQRGAPVEDAASAGVVSVRAILAPPPQQQPQQPSEPASPAPEGGGDAQGAILQPQGEPTQPPPEGEQPAAEPTPVPPPRPVRSGSGFAVVREGPTTFFATTYSLVADPNGPNGVAPEVEITIEGRPVAGAVHSWDVALDVALLRADAGEPTVADWRPQAEEVSVGDRLFAVALAPTGTTTEIATTIAAVEPRGLLTDLLTPAFALGGPLVDFDGRIVALVTQAYRPFGGDTPDGQVALPIGVLCEQLLRCGPEQLGTDDPSEEDG